MLKIEWIKNSSRNLCKEKLEQILLEVLSVVNKDKLLSINCICRNTLS